MIELKGVSWDHPRGHDSIVATSNAYSESHPEVSFTWGTRSLQDFADYPIEQLAENFDFIVLDHPFMGVAATSGCLLPLDEWLSPNRCRIRRTTRSARAMKVIGTMTTPGQWRSTRPAR